MGGNKVKMEKQNAIKMNKVKSKMIFFSLLK